jgi:hypothetical protein
MNFEGKGPPIPSKGKGIGSGLDWRQVQCQRTRRYIPMSEGEVTVTCPWCEEGETYQRIGPEHEAWHHVRLATDICRVEFGVPDDGLDAAVWLGSRPETVFEEHLDRHNIYLGRGADRWQHMYSSSHEAFHRVCGEGKNSPHWADEMLAVMFSLLYLERIGEVDHAHRTRIALVEEAPLVAREKLFEAISRPLPNRIYGRAYVLGEELQQVVGWTALKTLAVTRTSDGTPDIETWLDLLPGEIQDAVAQIVA